MSLSETGDFVGGWANSLALVWLIVVAVLQQRALQVQREELDISRREFRETRSEIKRQANAASEQAEHSAAILRLEHRRMYAESLIRDREMLCSMVLAIVLRASTNADRSNLEVTTLRNLIRTISKLIEHRIGDESSAAGRRGEIRRLADDALDVTNFFDELAEVSKTLGISPNSSVYHLRDYAHLYERCKRVQNIADALDDTGNAI